MDNKPSVTQRFNYIYSILVENPGDIIGLLAYAEYKREKIDKIKRMREQLGKDPEPHELEEFHKDCVMRVGTYRNIAAQNLTEFLKAYDNKVKCELDQEYKLLLEENLSKATPSFWRGVLESATGTVLYTLLIGAIVIIIMGARTGLSGLLLEFSKLLVGQ